MTTSSSTVALIGGSLGHSPSLPLQPVDELVMLIALNLQ
jgi:hypothetical protein